MRRREFLLTVAMLALAARHAVAQRSTAKKRIAVASGVMKVADMTIGGDPFYDILFNELKRLGYREGENLIVDRYSAGGSNEKYAALVNEVVSSAPDVIVSASSALTLLFKADTNTIPIVAYTGDPIRFGLITSLAHPGGNITGVSVDAGVEIWGKRLALLAEAVPKLTNVVVIASQGAWDLAGGNAVREAAQKLGVSLLSAIVASPYKEADYRRAFDSIRRDHVDGVMFSDEFPHWANRDLLVQLVKELRIPAMFVHRVQVEAGGLMSYSYDGEPAIRTNARQIVEILRGAKPADMPYVQEVRFQLVINLKTAKTLGLEIPASLLARADNVIE